MRNEKNQNKKKLQEKTSKIRFRHRSRSKQQLHMSHDAWNKVKLLLSSLTVHQHFIFHIDYVLTCAQIIFNLSSIQGMSGECRASSMCVCSQSDWSVYHLTTNDELIVNRFSFDFALAFLVSLCFHHILSSCTERVQCTILYVHNDINKRILMKWTI